jgi:hypothetical protein
MQISLIYKIPLEVCITFPVLVYHFMPQYLSIEKFHQPLPIESSIGHVDFVQECRISCLPEGMRLSPLHGSALSYVTISFLCLLISR